MKGIIKVTNKRNDEVELFTNITKGFIFKEIGICVLFSGSELIKEINTDAFDVEECKY